jgi:hypothetical protein
MTTYSIAAAFAFIEEHGIVLVSAKGPVPRLIDAVAGEHIGGNWWCVSRTQFRDATLHTRYPFRLGYHGPYWPGQCDERERGRSTGRPVVASPFGG